MIARRGFLAACGALVVPWEPERVYSFGKPGVDPAYTSLETTITLTNSLRDAINEYHKCLRAEADELCGEGHALDRESPLFRMSERWREPGHFTAIKFGTGWVYA